MDGQTQLAVIFTATATGISFNMFAGFGWLSLGAVVLITVIALALMKRWRRVSTGRGTPTVRSGAHGERKPITEGGEYILWAKERSSSKSPPEAESF